MVSFKMASGLAIHMSFQEFAYHRQEGNWPVVGKTCVVC